MKTDDVVRLFDAEEVASGMRRDPFVGAAGGGLPEYQAGVAGSRIYFPGGSAPLDEASAEIMEAGPSGYLLVGGARRKKNRRQTKRRKQRGGSRRKTGRRNGSAFRLNLRAQIRLRSRSRY